MAVQRILARAFYKVAQEKLGRGEVVKIVIPQNATLKVGTSLSTADFRKSENFPPGDVVEVLAIVEQGRELVMTYKRVFADGRIETGELRVLADATIEFVVTIVKSNILKRVWAFIVNLVSKA